MVVAAALVLGGLHVLWLARFRWGYVTDWDEAGYATISLRYLDGLTGGPADLVHALRAGGAQPPVVTGSAVPLMLVFGRSVDVAQVVDALYAVALVIATYGVARHLVAPAWATLAAACVGTMPIVSDYARLFHFAVPAAALLTGTLWALLCSNGLRRRAWVLAAAVLLALALLARTMTVAYIPGVLLGVGLPLFVHAEDRRVRARNLALLCVVSAAIAAVWWVPTWRLVTSYLANTGYGADASAYGASHPITSLDYWTAELKVTFSYLYVPLGGALLACLLVAALLGRPSRRRVRDWPASPAFLLAAVVIEGYLALTSTRTQGTGFQIPWLPALVVLAVAAAAAVPQRPVRWALAGTLVAVVALNLAMKNGVSSALAGPTQADLPVLGRVTVLDGRDVMYSALNGRGYGTKPPPARLPAMHRGWTTLNDRMARFIHAYAARRGRVPFVTIGTGDYWLNDTRLQLAYTLAFNLPLEKYLITGGGDVNAYHRPLGNPQSNVLLLAEPPPRLEMPVNALLVALAADRLGYHKVLALRAPDGRRVQLWWRDAGLRR